VSIFDAARQRIFKVLPKQWDFSIKAKHADYILAPLRVHIQRMETEMAELDAVIDRLSAEQLAPEEVEP